MRQQFNRIADAVTRAVGSPGALIVAALIIVVWAVTGPIFGFSDTWQLVINTGTTIVTFLMVFVIQNTQNRDAKAVHLKLDELIAAIEGARNRIVLAENLTEDEQDIEIARLVKGARRNPGRNGMVHVVANVAEVGAEEAEATAKKGAAAARQAKQAATVAKKQASRPRGSSNNRGRSSTASRSG